MQEQVKDTLFSKGVNYLNSQVAQLYHKQIENHIKTAGEQNDMATIVALMNSHLSASQVQQQGCARHCAILLPTILTINF